ncbi:hypothetical protein MA20_42935 [Bradyrhizobium japonicum]|uniref:Uncharacterized protein n=1 Tax=Bradyrhizobium japonicum TaxID=375 RepID=A0A0A3XKM4_BRAJP|nr:hypothetical protein [Bradyrhizobium japonicum]KGT73706.1 hypothetical protein MA20_42935 [Bradyrhizobium japonicum]
MAKLILSSYPAERNGAFVSVHLCLSGDALPFPGRTVEIQRAADAAREFETYRADVAATGKPAVVSMRIGRRDRSPPGFKKLPGASGFHEVNL